MSARPFTERSNPITENIDISSAAEMVQLLFKTDQQIFAGFEEQKNLFHDDILSCITKVANIVKDTLKRDAKDVAIVFSGCGTSGRFAYLTTKLCNLIFSKKSSGGPFYYTIAGGDKSVLTSQEAPEDNPAAGVEALLKICEGKNKVVFIGISVGISAPFVGGQIEHCLHNLDRFTPVLLGFNPVELARNVKIPVWNKSMRDVALEMDKVYKAGKAYIINPIIGPESISGSSRMKGGSVTKIILDAMIYSAINASRSGSTAEMTKENIASVLMSYQETCRMFYESKESAQIAQLIELGGKALTEKGNIRYVASDWNGVLALIDSTECPPTYGATTNDVRAFIHGGYDFLEIPDFGKTEHVFQLAIDDFISMYDGARADTVKDAIIVFIQSPNDPVLADLRSKGLQGCLRSLKGCKSLAAVLVDKPGNAPIEFGDLEGYFSQVVRIPFPKCSSEYEESWSEDYRSAIAESRYGLCLKWILNAISTGSHVKLGKVYKNHMCDAKCSNNKLYYRAIGLIQTLCGNVTYEKAEECLLKSIFEVDAVTEEILKTSIPERQHIGGEKDKIIPIGIILASLDCSVATAKEMLQRHNVVRNAIIEATRS